MAPMRAREGIIDVWQADLDDVGDDVEGLLCAEEHARARQILGARNRRLWVLSRGLLRALLARYLAADPRELRFAFGPHGKPALRGGDTVDAFDPLRALADLRFNLSHSGAIALYAITAMHDVGVDVERSRERYTADFLRAWVAREAAVKCRGSSLAGSRLLSPDGGVWTSELDVGPRATAAVASAGGPSELRRREWRG
jgi:phosphopantetheinyl transferase